MQLVTLKHAAEFRRIRGGQRWSTPRFVIEGKPRPAEAPAAVARFGFIITRKIGSAVVRNRIRRRLRSILRGLEADLANPAFDYVIVPRPIAADDRFADLERDMRTALGKLHTRTGGSQTAKPSSSASKIDAD